MDLPFIHVSALAFLLLYYCSLRGRLDAAIQIMRRYTWFFVYDRLKHDQAHHFEKKLKGLRRVRKGNNKEKTAWKRHGLHSAIGR